jgi:hypothetical protein
LCGSHKRRYAQHHHADFQVDTFSSTSCGRRLRFFDSHDRSIENVSQLATANQTSAGQCPFAVEPFEIADHLHTKLAARRQ